MILQEFNLSNQSYEIKDELKIRKILEYNTDYKFMFVKNDDPYAYDMMAFRYDIFENGKYDKNFLGFVEIERKWNSGWITNWSEISFLKRKICKWENNIWKNEPKENIDKTYYLKFNNDYTDCFCALIKDIWNNGYDSYRSDGSYNGTFIVLPKESIYIKYGIKDSIKYIEKGLCK